MMRIRIRTAKNQSKLWETHLKIDKKKSPEYDILEIEITLLLHAHK